MNCLFLYNPSSGKSKIYKHLNYIKETLLKKFSEVTVWETTSKEDMIFKATEACGTYDSLVFAGGDGTFNDVLNAIMTKAERPVLGYIPTGTANDIARTYRIPKNLKKALKIITDGYHESRDIGKVNDMYFMYVLAKGAFTNVSFETPRKNKKKLGRIAYGLWALKEIPKISSYTINVEFDDGFLRLNTPLILVANSRSISGFNFNCEGARNDTTLDLIILRSKPTNVIFSLLKMVLEKIRLKKPSRTYNVFRSSFFKIKPNDNNFWCVDGEKGITGEVEIKCLGKMIDLYMRKEIKNK